MKITIKYLKVKKGIKSIYIYIYIYKRRKRGGPGTRAPPWKKKKLYP